MDNFITKNRLKNIYFAEKFDIGFEKHHIMENHILYPESVKLLHRSNKRKFLNLLEIIKLKKAEKPFEK